MLRSNSRQRIVALLVSLAISIAAARLHATCPYIDTACATQRCLPYGAGDFVRSWCGGGWILAYSSECEIAVYPGGNPRSKLGSTGRDCRDAIVVLLRPRYEFGLSQRPVRVQEGRDTAGGASDNTINACSGLA